MLLFQLKLSLIASAEKLKNVKSLAADSIVLIFELDKDFVENRTIRNLDFLFEVRIEMAILDLSCCVLPFFVGNGDIRTHFSEYF